MTVDILAIIAIVLTMTMFVTQEAMLGFPCGIFWAILGGYAYTQTAGFFPPVDTYAFLSLASLLGMTPFTIYAAYALRTKKEDAEVGDLYLDEGGDADVKFIDEYASPAKARDYYDEYGNTRSKYKQEKTEEEEVVSDKVKSIRGRAVARRNRFNH